MKKIIIIGAGGHGAEIDEYILYSKQKTRNKDLEVIGFLDDNPDNYSKYKLSAPLLGSIQNHDIHHDCEYIIGIANLKYRRPIIENFLSKDAQFTSFVHCDAYVSPSAYLGKGVVIAPHVNIGPNVKIGDFTLLNARCSMGHDSNIGNFNFICPNVCFSGFTRVGDENLFGINSATIPSIQVGNRNKIAAGMVLDKNIGDDSVVFFRHKEKVLAIPKGS
ncbi:acetyltransferase [Rapidithrix thailandica]|uniref:Acetyltransferase n=1 Tax=Rapidithrix thailandica TaxID=413964 RepID=A0AAW9SFQ3_9BACT